LVTVFDKPPPERGCVDDRNAVHLAEGQDVGIGADHVVGGPGDRALQELVVRGVTTHPDRNVGLNKHGVTPELKQHGAGLARRDVELSPEFRAAGDRVNFGKDRRGDKEDELVGAPCFVETRRQALGAGEGTPQQDLRVKDDRERGQRGSPRR
jgi:hypothetical protein